jgi:hypothetical protein
MCPSSFRPETRRRWLTNCAPAAREPLLVPLLQALDDLALLSGTASKALERGDAPGQEAPGWEAAQELIQLVMRRGLGDEHKSAIANGQATGHDLLVCFKLEKYVEGRQNPVLWNLEYFCG